MKILINRTDAIGDLILTLPMVEFLKKHYPHSEIYVLSSERNNFVLNEHPLIKKIFIDNLQGSKFSRLKKLIKIFHQTKFTHYFYLGGSHLASFVALLNLVSFRGGLKSRWQSFLFLNQGVRQKRSEIAMHESFYNIQTLAPLKIPVLFLKRSDYPAKIYVSEEERMEYQLYLKTMLAARNIDDHERPYIVVHPGMTGHTLNWSLRNYARLVRFLEKRLPKEYLFFITYTPSDEVFVEPVRQEFTRPEYIEANKKTFFINGKELGSRFFMALLERAKLFVGPSTGPLHMADALGVKVVGIYSPIKVQSSTRWGPYNESNSKKVLVPDVVCGETNQCAMNDCPYFECMPTIEVEDVVKAVRELLAKQ